jgi:hypothetical protein
MMHERKDGAQGADRSAGASGKIQNQGLRVPAIAGLLLGWGEREGSAEAPAEGGVPGFLAAFEAHEFGEAFDEPVADGAGGLRGDVTGGNASAAGGYDERYLSGGGTQRVFDGGLYVCY